MDEIQQQALQSALLELQFERAKDKLQRIYEDERARVLRVNLMLQEDTNDELQEQLGQVQDVELKQSEDLAQELQDRLAEVEEQYEATQTALKTCLRDIDTYQTEINALNATNASNTKVLTEKLALSRELTTLKPELEHLRSQVAASDNVLADKLSLQRELAAVQVELETERRSVERLKQKSDAQDAAVTAELENLKAQLAKEKKQVQKFDRLNAKRANQKSVADAALADELETLKHELQASQRQAQQAESRLEEALRRQSAADDNAAELRQLQAELTKERKASQKAEREYLKKSTEWDVQKETLETKLDAFRNKLRATKAQLKEAQDELERREQAKFAESAAATKARMGGRAASVDPPQAHQPQNPRKRNVARFDPDMTIGTPGHGGVAKKPRVTNVGDRSTFSITPFLNRTQSILPESPNAVMDETINELAEAADKEKEQRQEKEAQGKSAKAGAGDGLKKTAANKAAEANKAKQQPPLDSNKRANAVVKAPVLDKVVEEDDDDDDNDNAQSDCSNAASTVAAIEVTEATTLQPKKKKLLGARKNIFDDNEPDGIKKVGAGLGKVRLGLGKNKPKMLAEFSPLKKERRMTQANTTTMIGA